MTQSPAGWHMQPDGRERYWDGTQWTEHYRAPQAPMMPPPQQYYAQQPVKKSHTLRNVILGVVIGGLLIIGGCVALIGKAANDVGNEIDKSDHAPGGPKNPMAIQIGKAFSVQDFDYAAGWKIRKEQYTGDIEIVGLKVTNNRDDRDSALVEIKFHRGSEILASADCTSEPIQVGTTVTLTCISTDKLPAGYDRITINDSF